MAQFEQFGAVDFTPITQVTSEEETWDVGIAKTSSDLHYPIALAEDRSYGVMLHTNLVDAQGQVEDFTLYRQMPGDTNLHTALSAKHLPTELVDGLKQLAAEHHAFYAATHAPYQVPENGEVSSFHTVFVNNEQWRIGALGTDEGAVPIAQSFGSMPQGTKLGTPPMTVVLTAQTIDESAGTIGYYNQHVGGPAVAEGLTEADVPARVTEELVRFGNLNKCFGPRTQDYETFLDGAVERITENLDAELAALQASAPPTHLRDAKGERANDHPYREPPSNGRT